MVLVCTLSAAITSFMAQGFTSLEASRKAKEYLSHAIFYSRNESVGTGNGPVHHFYNLWQYL